MQTPLRLLGLSTLAIGAMTTAALASSLRGPMLPRSAARDFGAVNSGQHISITVHLKRPNAALFQQTVDALYDRQSPTYHHWLSDAQLARFAPQPAQVAAVRSELERNGLSIASVSVDGTAIRTVGTVGAAARAFHTQIHQFSLNGSAFRANTAPAALAGPAGSYVASVSGLESHTVKPMLRQAENFYTKKPLTPIALSKVLDNGGLSSIITGRIIGPKKTFTYTTGGGLPSATYTGYTYQPNPNLVPDYTPAQIQDITRVTTAYRNGYNGAGQTIVLLEGYGYPTMLSDANAFSQLTGLPPLTASNFSVVYPEGTPNPEAGELTGWNTEIALDIDWAHSIAPGAKIEVVATNGQDTQDFEASMQYIIDHDLGNSVSDSWEEDLDLIAGPAEQEGFEEVLDVAAAKGISFQFSTGDSGDDGLGTPVGAAGVPSNAPHATAVGGTSILNVPGSTTHLNFGWGDVFDVLEIGGAPIPPNEIYESLGGGGGESVFWPKPAWQAALPGIGRQTPDVSALADPYTGVPIVLTEYGEQYVFVGIGGTSLASPIFTGIWAIANERAGHPLGQAAPTIARLKSGITDILPIQAPFSGSYTDSSGTTQYTADSLFSYLVQNDGFSTQPVTSVIWDQPQYQQSAAFAFGFDTSLSVTAGWDNATGYGTPRGYDFIDAAAY